MKKWLAAGFLAGSVALTAPAWAQMAPAPAYDTTGAYANPADAGYATYQTTGWDPSIIAYASGGLGLAGLALKGFLRRGTAEE